MIKSISNAFGVPVGYSDHSTSTSIPSIAVALEASGGGYKIPGALGPNTTGIELINSFDLGYSDGQVSTVAVVNVGSGYSRILSIELFENSDPDWTVGEFLIPMSRFDTATWYSLAGWNIERGLGKIFSIDTVDGKSIYNVGPIKTCYRHIRIKPRFSTQNSRTQSIRRILNNNQIIFICYLSDGRPVAKVTQ